MVKPFHLPLVGTYASPSELPQGKRVVSQRLAV